MLAVVEALESRLLLDGLDGFAQLLPVSEYVELPGGPAWYHVSAVMRESKG